MLCYATLHEVMLNYIIGGAPAAQRRDLLQLALPRALDRGVRRAQGPEGR